MKCRLNILVHKQDGTVVWMPEPVPKLYTHDEAVSQGRWWVACNPGVVTAFSFVWEDE